MTQHKPEEAAFAIGEPQSSSRRQAGIAFIFVTVLLDMLAIGVIIPVLPKLVVDFEAGNTEQAAQIYGVFGMT